MELEQLKSVWQKTTNSQEEGYFISIEKMQLLIKKRSNTAIAKVKRGVLNKVFIAGTIGLLMLSFSAFVFITDEKVFSNLEKITNVEVGIFYLIFGLVICFISVFNGVSYRRIRKIEKYESDLKTSIKSILEVLKSAINAKIFSDTIVLPLTVIILSVVSYIRETGAFADPKIVLLSFLVSVVMGWLLYFFTKRGQCSRYGDQMDILEDSLKELETEEE